jgi:hypothetical protein
MKNIYKILIASIILFGSLIPAISNAQLNPTEDPNNSAFKLIYCDGPKLPDAVQKEWNTENPNKKYIVCDFAGAMGQVQHLINIMMVVGVLAAIVLFAYAGYLHVSVSFTGKEEDIKKARTIFKKVMIGFAIMLCAWFIVYQILSWLAADSSATALLQK